MRYKRVKLSGNLIFSAPLARQEIKKASKTRSVELDLSDVDVIDSVGISMILQLHKDLEAKGGTLRLSGVRPGIADTFKSSGMDKIIDIIEIEQ